jgi:hypothetical protein
MMIRATLCMQICFRGDLLLLSRMEMCYIQYRSILMIGCCLGDMRGGVLLGFFVLSLNEFPCHDKENASVYFDGSVVRNIVGQHMLTYKGLHEDLYDQDRHASAHMKGYRLPLSSLSSGKNPKAPIR